MTVIGADWVRGRWTGSVAQRRQVTIILVTAIIACARFAGKHGLVVGALALFAISAGMLSPIAGLAMSGFGLMFLEWRRR